MNYAHRRGGFYDPDALNIVGGAFDKAIKGLSPEAKADPSIRRNLARCLFELVP